MQLQQDVLSRDASECCRDVGASADMPQVQALIQGRASAWQQNLVLTPTKGGAGDPVSPLPYELPLMHIVTRAMQLHNLQLICTGAYLPAV